MEKAMIKYSVVIPVYNGAAYLDSLYQRLTRVMEKITFSYEIICVDDCSTDQGWEILTRLRSGDRRLKLIRLSKNFGQHNATMCGFKYCSGDYVITMDDDLQHPPEEIPKLLGEIKKGHSLVYGRYKEKKHHWVQNLGSSITNKVLANITNNEFDLTSFRVIRIDAVRAIVDYGFSNSILDMFLLQTISRNDISYCEVKHDKAEVSGYNFMKLVHIAASIVINHTVFPLRFVTFLGFACSMISFSMGLVYLIKYFFNHIDVSGFTTIVLLITFFSGILLLVLGIIGEYIGMIFLIASKRPQYIVKELFF